jgi:chromate transporter
MVKKHNKIIDLIKSLLTIGTVGFGGGAAVIPLFHKEFVERYNWFTDEEFTDILAISNALPGPIQTKISGYIGYKKFGILGTLLAILSIVSPSLIVMLLFYNAFILLKDNQYINGAINAIFPIVTTLMLALTIDFFKKSKKQLNASLFYMLLGVSFFSLNIFNLHPATFILLLFISITFPKIDDLKRIFLLFLFSYIIFLADTYGGIFAPLESLQHISLKEIPEALKLVFAFLIPGVMGYGGGPGSLSLISYEAVEQFQLLTGEEFALAVAIQSTLPGVTATKLAGTIGFMTTDLGLIGLLIAVASYVLPSLFLMIGLMNLITKYKNSQLINRLTTYIGPMIVVLLGTLAVSFFITSIEALTVFYGISLFLGSYYLYRHFKLHPFFIIIGSMVIGVIITLI